MRLLFTALCWTTSVTFMSACGSEGIVTPSDTSSVLPVTLVLPAHTIVVGGGEHACVLRPSGSTSCWGTGQAVGGGTGREFALPHMMSAPPFAAITAGASHTCALTTSGEAYCWGVNRTGALGDGSQQNRTEPARVKTPLRFTTLEAAGSTNCGIASDDRIYCWGDNGLGALGDPSIATDSFVSIPHPVVGQVKLRTLSGGAHVCGLDVQGVVYCWGHGTGVVVNDRFPSDLLSHITPNGAPAASACTSWFFFRDVCKVPTPVQGTMSLVQLTVGGGQDCGLTAGREVVCWGDNAYGAVGATDSTAFRAPHPVRGLDGPTSFVTAATFTTCALGANGAAQCWGNNFLGYLGTGTAGGPIPWPVAVTGGHRFQSLEAGPSDICGVEAITQDVWCWGSNLSGVLALPASIYSSATPVRIPLP